MTKIRLIEMLESVLTWGTNHDKEFRKSLIEALGITEEEYKEVIHKDLNTYLDKEKEKDLGLPDKVTLKENVIEDFDYDDGEVDDDSLQECIDNYLSNEYGYCINDYNYKCHYNEKGKLIEIDIYNIDWDTTE